MKSSSPIVSCLFALLVVAGCASTEMTDRQEFNGGKLPRPGHIWVYDFAATPAEIPADSALAGQTTQHRHAPNTRADRARPEIGRTNCGAAGRGNPQLGTASSAGFESHDAGDQRHCVRGYLLSIEEGSGTKRVTIGFGHGASELTTAVEGFQMTAQGLRKLGSGKINATSGKSPGGALGVVGLIVTANPAGLIIGGGVKAYEEHTGSSKVEGRAKDTAKEIMEVLKKRFQEEGWIQ